MTSVCFASWKGFAGCVASCRHAAGVLGASWVALDEGEIPQAALDADVLFVSSWTPQYEALLGRRGGPTIGRWHSSLLQTELSREGWKLSLLLGLVDEGRLDGIVADDAETAAALSAQGIGHLPNVFDRSQLMNVQPIPLTGVNVCLPGEPYGRKNLIVQATGFERAREDRDWTLHLFGQTQRRPGYAEWFTLAGLPYVDHGYLDHRDYLAHVAAMDAVLCASLSESYGYAAAEAAELGVPVVATRAIRSLDAGDLIVADPTSVDNVTAALKRALADRQTVAAQRDSLHHRSRDNESIARAAIGNLDGVGAPGP